MIEVAESEPGIENLIENTYAEIDKLAQEHRILYPAKKVDQKAKELFVLESNDLSEGITVQVKRLKAVDAGQIDSQSYISLEDKANTDTVEVIDVTSGIDGASLEAKKSNLHVLAQRHPSVQKAIFEELIEPFIINFPSELREILDADTRGDLLSKAQEVDPNGAQGIPELKDQLTDLGITQEKLGQLYRDLGILKNAVQPHERTREGDIPGDLFKNVIGETMHKIGLIDPTVLSEAPTMYELPDITGVNDDEAAELVTKSLSSLLVQDQNLLSEDQFAYIQGMSLQDIFNGNFLQDQLPPKSRIISAFELLKDIAQSISQVEQDVSQKIHPRKIIDTLANKFTSLTAFYEMGKTST